MFDFIHCPHHNTRIAKQIAANGAEQCFIQCVDCGANVTEAKTGKPGSFLRKPANSAALPVVNDYREAAPVCEVCGAVGVELHHWAPVHLFGIEAHNWPTAYLCPQCHALWHTRVTPGMCGTQGGPQ